MPRYNDTDKTLNAIMTEFRVYFEIPCDGDDRRVQEIVKRVIKVIENQPAIDVVPRRLYEEQLKSPLPFPTESEIATSVLDEVEELLNECRMHLIVGYDKVSVDHKLAALRAKYANADYRPHKELIKERNDLEYKLIGVMHFVDKWLDDDELKQPEVNRAATMREKTLQIVEGQRSEIERLQRVVNNSLPSGVQACSEEGAMKIGYERGRAAATKELLNKLSSIKQSYVNGTIDENQLLVRLARISCLLD